MGKTTTFQRIVLAAGILACLAVACAPEQPATRTQPPAPEPPDAAPKPLRIRIAPGKLAREVHDRINRERRKRGLPTFRWDGELGRIAGKHSRDMAKRNFFSHVSPDGRGPAQRYLAEHYACGVTIDGVLRNGAEVIHRFSRDSAGAYTEKGKAVLRGIAGQVVGGWLGTDKDGTNLLSPHWQREGVGVSLGPGGMVYITINFC